MVELVALVPGAPARRRVVLEWAGRAVGRTGHVHVVCDGMAPWALTSSFVWTGLVLDMERIERADFAQAAEILAPLGCGWNWHHAQFGAHDFAVRLARHCGTAIVLSRRHLLRTPSVRVIAPDVELPWPVWSLGRRSPVRRHR
ncbi:hypothetical protein OHB12_05585 [Nocardia sp. NBC_01730]|uniref:hypothetical protein n=1 Tax=Nocardia sp. NBC_01730 TaxID=2975998 RepID=UPI002E0DA6DC|nr:hypothetical protein OHB12_05585 [Nocardia sp. NBC_01730]